MLVNKEIKKLNANSVFETIVTKKAQIIYGKFMPFYYVFFLT